MMNIQYYCTNKIYIRESIQVHDQDLSAGQEIVTMGIQGQRVGFTGEGMEAIGLLMSVGKQ